MDKPVIDKSKWGEGPWQDEPDEKSWVDPATGYRCAIARNDVMGHLCGYVGVRLGHPMFGADMHDDRVRGLDTHGVVNFARIKDGVWWFGFDCGYSFDFAPGTELLKRELGLKFHAETERVLTYREFSYVIGRVEELAAQLHALRDDEPK